MSNSTGKAESAFLFPIEKNSSRLRGKLLAVIKVRASLHGRLPAKGHLKGIRAGDNGRPKLESKSQSGSGLEIAEGCETAS